MKVHSMYCSREVTERVRIESTRLHGGELTVRRVTVRECPCGGIEIDPSKTLVPYEKA